MALLQPNNPKARIAPSSEPGAFEALPRSFYLASASVVASRLLGHWLIREVKGQIRGGPIVETEAYLRDDPACHAARGRTERNAIMFGPPGYAYVYFIYGCYYCANAVCLPQGMAEAVLIRAIEPAFGIDSMRLSRPGKSDAQLASGPGKLCQALVISRRDNGLDLTNSPLIIARNPRVRAFRRTHGPVRTSPRIGISRAASLPLRFYLAGNAHVSGKRVSQPPPQTPRELDPKGSD